MNTPYIDIKNLSLRRNGKTILHNLTWRMNKNEHWAVIGANGSGKTTLLKITGGNLFPTAGEVTVLGQLFGRTDLMTLRQRIGWVGPALLDRMPPHESLRDIVASGFKATYGRVYEISPADTQRVEETLAKVGLQNRGDAAFGVLSQGEQQRALFARSMLSSPELYILDEACSGLDLPAREHFLGVVNQVMQTGDAGVIMVTHHIEEIPSGITHALVLHNGAVLAAGPVEDTITGPVLSKAFGIPVEVERKDRRFWARMA